MYFSEAGASPSIVFEILATGTVYNKNGSPINVVNLLPHPGANGCWFPITRLALVPPETPKYRLAHWVSTSFVEVLLEGVGTHRTTGVFYGTGELAKTVEEAEAMARAAMGVAGYEIVA